MEADRSRQQDLVNQSQLSEYRTGVIGTGPIADVVLAQILGLGISTKGYGGRGRIYLIDDKVKECIPDEFLLFGETPDNKLSYLKNLLKKADFRMRVTALGNLDYLQDGAVDSLVDLTNDRESKRYGLDYCKKNNNIPFISASADSRKASLAVYYPNLLSCDSKIYRMKSFNGKRQGIGPSGFIGTVATELLKNWAIGKKTKIKNPFVYSLNSSDRVNDLDDLALDLNFSGTNVLVVGAGGSTGIWYCITHAINAGDRGNTITAVESDYIQAVNLNRQILYFWHITEGSTEKIDKIIALQERLGKINPALTVVTRKARLGMEPTPKEKERNVEYLDESFIKNGGFDLIVGCIDNEVTRAFLNRCAVDYNIPYIDASVGVNPDEQTEKSTVNVYVPGESFCLNCAKDVEGEAEGEIIRENERRAGGCPAEPNPSIIMPNAMGGITAGNESHLFLSGNKDYRGKSIFVYTTDVEDRLRIYSFKQGNTCKLNCY